MIHTRKLIHISLFSLIFASLIKFSAFLKASFIVGSYTGFFSGVNITTPLAGHFGGMLGSFGVFGLLLGLRFFLTGIKSLHLLAYHIPGLFGSLYWATESIFIRLLVPLACMVAFIAHPVGGQAWFYTLYWLIPISLYFVAHKNIFLHAVSSTFIAHAVGSVIWIYALPMTPAIWIGLIPVVAIERLTFATGMVVVHRVINCCLSTLKDVPVFRGTVVINRSK